MRNPLRIQAMARSNNFTIVGRRFTMRLIERSRADGIASKSSFRFCRNGLHRNAKLTSYG